MNRLQRVCTRLSDMLLQVSIHLLPKGSRRRRKLFLSINDYHSRRKEEYYG